MLAMIRIWFNGRKAGECGWFVNRAVVLASYNSRYFRIFIASVLVTAAIVIIFNLLFLKGVIAAQVFWAPAFAHWRDGV